MKINDEIIVEIVQINHDGEGLGKYDGYVVHVSDAFARKTVRAKITGIMGKSIHAELLGVVSDENTDK